MILVHTPLPGLHCQYGSHTMYGFQNSTDFKELSNIIKLLQLCKSFHNPFKGYSFSMIHNRPLVFIDDLIHMYLLGFNLVLIHILHMGFRKNLIHICSLDFTTELIYSSNSNVSSVISSSIICRLPTNGTIIGSS